MKCFTSLSRVGLMLALVAGIGLVGPLGVARADSYIANGVISAVHTSGDTTVGKLHGKSDPGGHFKGTFSFVNVDGVLNGEVVYSYRDGSISLDYVAEFDEGLGMFVGTFTITGGSGAYDGATGSGALTVKNGKFTLSGTIWP